METLKVRDIKDVEEVVRAAIASEQPLEIIGHGSKRAIGHPMATNAVLDVSVLLPHIRSGAIKALAGTSKRASVFAPAKRTRTGSPGRRPCASLGATSKRHSVVCVIASVAGTVAVPTSGPYSASKSAQIAFSRAVCAELKPAGIRVRGRRSTPGRYFQVAQPGLGWGGTDVSDPLDIIEKIDPKVAWPGLKLLMVSTTGEHSGWFVLDNDLKPQPNDMPDPVRAVVERIAENCEPALCTVLFMAGAGGSLRAGVTENPVRLTRSVRDALTKVTLGGVPAYVWPGGGITLMVDVSKMPEKSFGYVPTPALVAPIEFTLRADDYAALGGYASRAVSLQDVLRSNKVRLDR